MGNYDVIVAADVLYNDPHGQLLATTLDVLVPKGSGTEVFLAYLQRDNEDQLDFFVAMFQMGFCLERFQDELGNAVAGDSLSAYDCGSFVRLVPEAFFDPPGQATLRLDDVAETVQIFRVMRPT